MPSELLKRAEKVVAAFREELSPETREAIGQKGFADLTVIVQEALQLERAEVAGQFEAMARALRVTTEPVDIGL